MHSPFAIDADSNDDRDADATNRGGPVAEGAKGGFVATVAMTAYRAPVSRTLPPTARFWSKVVGGDPDDHPVAALALHVLYGVAAGGLFGAVAGRIRSATEARREVDGVILGVGYALALSAFGESVILERLLDMDLQSDESLVFHVGHLVYGLTLGTWLGSRTGGESVSESSP